MVQTANVVRGKAIFQLRLIEARSLHTASNVLSFPSGPGGNVVPARRIAPGRSAAADIDSASQSCVHDSHAKDEAGFAVR